MIIIIRTVALIGAAWIGAGIVLALIFARLARGADAYDRAAREHRDFHAWSEEMEWTP